MDQERPKAKRAVIGATGFFLLSINILGYLAKNYLSVPGSNRDLEGICIGAQVGLIALAWVAYFIRRNGTALIFSKFSYLPFAVALGDMLYKKLN